MTFIPLARALSVAAIVLGANMAMPAFAASPVIDAAIADPGRPAKDTALDAERKPAEILAFIRLKPGATIVDVAPGTYWDRLFSKVVGPEGHVYEFMPDELAKAEHKALPAQGSAPIADLPNVTAYSGPTNSFAVPTAADIVWIRQNYHDIYDPFMAPADVPSFNKAVFKSLKKGGYFVIIDHSAPDGSGIADTNTTHRIDAAVVKKDLAAAGFVFVGESAALRNPADPRDKMVFDPSIRGKTDQFIYLFKKP
jgi:predicted methyltransferase